MDLAVAKGRAARRAFVTHNFGLAARVADDIYGKLSASDRGLLSLDEFTHEVYSVGRSGCSSVELGDKWPCASVYAWACDTHNWWRFPVVGTVARGWG